MKFFVSIRERRLWLWTLAVVVAIYSTLRVVPQLSGFLRDRNLLDDTFFAGFLLMLVAIAVQGLRLRPGGAEIGIGLGIIVVYFMVFLRMNIPEERSHLVEYSIVALLIFEALKERVSQGRRVPVPALLAIGLTTLIGFIDEIIQLFLPNRYFDFIDVGFNALAALMAVGAGVVLSYARDRWGRNKVVRQE
jgi:hypothetical protein